eukprot:CAMPEP_0206491100 /NCGR_PEP_ID=MMETSP0324_2-20121206/44668_1 /ASSEMBLY_ACC=CAM_ASM_000836 /TAXON_ID=2866 /ORGANISM="Crypthecodinium cohnii, Strain Seligo" /LENGTH=231 /DNA_ID=CAMNT_0053971973 /DNA_START=156 /DNA_END=851 /DNA_ORIENTATION=+
MTASGVLPAAMAIGLFFVNMNLPEVQFTGVAASRTPIKSDVVRETEMQEVNASYYDQKGMLMESYGWKVNHTSDLAEAAISDPFFDEDWTNLESALKYMNDRRLEAFWVDRLLLDLWHGRMDSPVDVAEPESLSKEAQEDPAPVGLHLDRALVHLFHHRWEQAFDALCLALAPLRPWTAARFWSSKAQTWFKAHPILLFLAATAVDLLIGTALFKSIGLMCSRPSTQKTSK